MTPTGPLLFAYDGSTHARAAIERAGSLLRPGRAVVVTAWSTLAVAAPAALLALPGGVITAAVADIDTATREAAEATAAEGVQLAAAVGFDARPQVIHSAGAIFAAIIACADELDAAAIVLGSRGRSPLASTFLGSVSTGVLHHTARPVLVAQAPLESSLLAKQIGRARGAGGGGRGLQAQCVRTGAQLAPPLCGSR